MEDQVEGDCACVDGVLAEEAPDCGALDFISTTIQQGHWG